MLHFGSVYVLKKNSQKSEKPLPCLFVLGAHSMFTVSSVYLLWTLFENQMKEKKCLKSIFFFFFSFISCHANSKLVNIQFSTNKKQVANMIPSALFWAMTKLYLQCTRQSRVVLFTLQRFCCLFVKILNVLWKFGYYNPLSQRQSMLPLSTFKKLKKNDENSVVRIWFSSSISMFSAYWKDLCRAICFLFVTLHHSSNRSDLQLL